LSGAAGTGVLFRSGTGLPSIGNSVDKNYIASTASIAEGIRFLNNVASSFIGGNRAVDNIIFGYSAATVGKGILSDGSGEKDNKFIRNDIDASVLDIDNSASVGSLIVGNKMNGLGFSTTTVAEYYGNSGAIVAGATLLKRTLVSIAEYEAAAMPAAGTFRLGDKVYNTSPTITAQQMVLTGWIRLTTGSGHVLNTDWANMYTSTVSPAT